MTLKIAFLVFLLATVTRTDAEWKDLLGEERYRVMRQKGTEKSFIGKYVLTTQEGTYVCAACTNPLFHSKNKYNVNNGWPSFTKPIHPKAVYYLEDWSKGFKRYEILCRECDSHLGHVFHDGPDPDHLRYCINSISLHLQEE